MRNLKRLKHIGLESTRTTPRTKRRNRLLAASAAAVLGCFGIPASAGPVNWINPQGGVFQDPSNWYPYRVPRDTDTAIFNLGSCQWPYTVEFLESSVVAGALHVLDDCVTLDLCGNFCTLVGVPPAAVPLLVGGDDGTLSRLEVWNGVLESPCAKVGNQLYSTGILTVTYGSALTLFDESCPLVVGGSACGVLNLFDGGLYISPPGPSIPVIYVGGEPAGGSGQGQIVVSGYSYLETPGLLSLGLNNGIGYLSVSAGGQVHTHAGAVIGTWESGYSEVEITDLGSIWISDGLNGFPDSGLVSVGRMDPANGYGGHGSVAVMLGATMSARVLAIAEGPGSEGNVQVATSGSTLGADTILVGAGGDAELLIDSGAQVSATDVIVGSSGPGWGRVTVFDRGSQLSATNLYIGVSGVGSVSASMEGQITCASLMMGHGALGTLSLDYPGSKLTVSGGESSSCWIGMESDASLTISYCATAEITPPILIGRSGSSEGYVNVTGEGSSLACSNALFVGYAGRGTLVVNCGGVVSNTSAAIGYQPGAVGSVTVADYLSSWDSSSTLTVADAGHGSLLITDGGYVSCYGARIARAPGSDGSVLVCGDGSEWTVHGSLYVGGDAAGPGGTANLSITDGGWVTVDQTLRIYPSGLCAITGGQLNASQIELMGGEFRASGSVFTPVLSNNGRINVAPSDWISLVASLTIAPGSSLTKAGDGTLIICGSQNHGPGSRISVVGGTLSLSTSGGPNLGIELGTGTNLWLRSNNPTSFAGGLTISGNATVGVDRSDPGPAVAHSISSLSLAAATLTTAGFNGCSFLISGTTTLTGNATINTTSANLALAGSVSGAGRTLTKTGSAALYLTASANLGGLSVNGGLLRLSGPGGAISGPATIPVRKGAILELNNSSALGGNHSTQNRLPNTTDLIVDGGTFSFIGADYTSSTETLGVLRPHSGASTLNLVAGALGSTTVTFSEGLVRDPGATLNIVANALGSSNKLFLTGQPSGFIAGWATVGMTDFAKYDTSGGGLGVRPFFLSDYVINHFEPDAHVRLDPSIINPPLPYPIGVGDMQIRTLNMAASTMEIQVSQTFGSTLTLSEGGLLKSGPNDASILYGNLQSGASELDVYTTGGDLRIGGQIIGLAGLVKSGSGKLILGSGSSDTYPNLYTGVTRIHDGILELDKAEGTIALRGTLEITGGTLISLRPHQLAPNMTLILSAGAMDLQDQAEEVANFTNSGGDFRTGAGTFTVTSPTTTTFAGGTTTINNGGTLNAAALLVTGGVNTVEAGGTLNVGAGGATFSGTSSPSITLNPGASAPSPGDPAPGLMNLSGDLSFTGSSGTALISSSVPAVNQLRGTISLSAGTRAFTINNGSSSPDMTISASIAGPGALRKAGAGLLRLTAPNSYAGGTTLANGILEVADEAGLGTNTVTFAGGQLNLRSDLPSPNFARNVNTTAGASVLIDIDRDSGSQTPGTFRLGSLSPASVLTVSGANGGTLSFTSATLAATLTINNSVGLTIDGPISQSAGLWGITKALAGTLTFSGAAPNTFSGTTTVNAGTLLLSKPLNTIAVPGRLTVTGTGLVRLSAGNQIAASSPVDINGSTGAATLDLSGNGQTISALSFVAGGAVTTGAGTLHLGGNVTFTGLAGAASISGQLDLGNSQRTFTVADGSQSIDLDISASVSGSAGLVKDGPGTLRLSSATSGYIGGTTIRNGALEISCDGALGYCDQTLTLAGGTLRPSGNVCSWRPLAVTSSSAIDVQSPSASSFGGDFSIAAGAILTKRGPKPLTFSGAQNHSNGAVLAVQANSATISSDAGSTASFPLTLTVSGGAAARFGDTQHLNSLQLAASTAELLSSGTRVLCTNGLSIDATSTLDLNDNDLILFHTDHDHGVAKLAYVTGKISSALNMPAGYWDGYGITSSAARNDQTFLTTLGVLNNDDGAGNPIYTEFSGQPLTQNAILVKYTYYGDNDLSGFVNLDTDFSLFVDGFNSGGTKTGWLYGDYSYDGIIDLDTDFSLFVGAYNNQGDPLSAIEIASLRRQLLAPVAAIPEPAALSLLTIGALGAVYRRPRR